MQRDLEETVLSLISTACRVERSSVSPEMTLYELGGSSMTVIAIAAGLQARLGCRLSSEQLQELFAAANIGELVGSVRQYLATP